MEGNLPEGSEGLVMEVSGNGAFLLYSSYGEFKTLSTLPMRLTGRHLYLIYFFVMYNFEVGGLIFDHNTLSDISLWYRGSRTQGLLGKPIQDQSWPLLNP